MRGRKPTPTHLKVVRGNPGNRPLPDGEPMPGLGAVMPTWLSPDAAAHWPEAAALLEEAGVLTRLDAAALGLYCEAFARWRSANDHVAKYGAVVKAPSGFPVQSPFLAIANKAWEQMLKVQVEFGMTPSSRVRVQAAPHDTAKKAGADRKSTDRFFAA